MSTANDEDRDYDFEAAVRYVKNVGEGDGRSLTKKEILSLYALYKQVCIWGLASLTSNSLYGRLVISC